MFQLSKLTTAQINSLSADLKKEINELKETTENFDADFYGIAAENDKNLYELAMKALPESKSEPEPTKKATPKKAKGGFQLSKLTAAQINSLSTDLKNEINELKETTENFDADYYEIAAENDKNLYELAIKSLSEPEKPAKKKPTKKTKYSQKQINGVLNAWMVRNFDPLGENVGKENFEKHPKYEEMVEKMEKFLQTDRGLTPSESKRKVKSFILHGMPKKGWEASKKEEPTPKTIPKAKSTPKQTANPTPELSFKKKMNTSKMEKVFFKCPFYVQELNKDTKALMWDGQKGVEVELQKGTFALFNDEGYLFSGMNKNSFQKRCVTNIEMVESTKLDTAKEKIGELKKEITALKNNSSSKPASAKPEPKPKPSNPKPSSSKPKPSKPTSSCTLDEANAAEFAAKMAEFIKDNMWENLMESSEIIGMYYGLKDGKIYTKIKNWSLTKKKIEWFELCAINLTKTKTEQPSRGSYRQIPGITQKKLKEIYTTKGPKIYKECLVIQRELHKCRRDGNCSTEQRNQSKLVYKSCGDLIKKTQIIPQFFREVWAEARKIQKKGESAHAAFGRAARKIAGR